MSQSQTEPACTRDSDASDVRTGPIDIDFDSRPGSQVNRIENETERNEGTFKPVYTALGEDIEVELLSRVPAAKSPHENGHLVITRPDWEEPRVALPQNVRVDIEDDFE